MGPVPRYKAALTAVFLSLIPGLAPAAEKAGGAIVPDESVKIGENRFRSPRSYEETLKFYRAVYGPRYTRRPIADTPSVKAVHIENPDARPGQWDGLNVYETKGETRIFVLVKKR